MTAREQSSCFTSRKVVRHHKTYNSGCRLDKLAEETMRILRVGHYRFLSSSSPSTVNLDKARLATSYISCKTIVVDTAAKSTAKACKNKRRIVPRRRTNGSGGIPLSVVVVEEDSFDAALAATKDSSKAPCVLDFASDTCPGGGWRTKQQGTQEESLCRRSSLGVCLENHHKRSGDAKFMPANGIVYCPEVEVFRSREGELLEKPVWVAVVAAALREVKQDVEIRHKVQGVMKVAADKGHRTIVLGAWGCGAFGNSPEMVASEMAAAVREESSNNLELDRVIVAVPDKRKAAIFRAALLG